MRMLSRRQAKSSIPVRLAMAALLRDRAGGGIGNGRLGQTAPVAATRGQDRTPGQAERSTAVGWYTRRTSRPGPRTASRTVARASGAHYLTLAFLQTPKRGSCTLAWNGTRSGW